MIGRQKMIECGVSNKLMISRWDNNDYNARNNGEDVV